MCSARRAPGRVLWLALLTLAASALHAAEPDGQLALPDFTALHAADSVDVTLDQSLLSLAAGYLDGHKPQDAAVKDAIAGIRGIYVKSYTFDKDFAYPQAAIDTVRAQLLGPSWKRIVQVKSGKDHSSVDIYIFQVSNQARGLAIISTEPREFTIVNIVGAIDLDKLHKLEGHFGIPKLPGG